MGCCNTPNRDVFVTTWNAAGSALVCSTCLGGDTGGGLNGSTKLIFDGPAATVHDDHATDVLTGSSGQDWFLLNIDGDGGVKDKVTDLHASEFANDIDFIGGP